MMDELKLETCRKMFAAAGEKLAVAENLYRSGYYNDSISRSYYAAYHAVSLLLFTHDQAYSSHGQLIGAFNRDFIATGRLPKELGKALGRLFDQRQVADYDFFERAEQSEASQGMQDAEAIVSAVKLLIEREFSVNLLE